MDNNNRDTPPAPQERPQPQMKEEPLLDEGGGMGGVGNIQLKGEEQETTLKGQEEDEVGNKTKKKRNRKKNKKGTVKSEEDDGGTTEDKGQPKPKELEKPPPPLALPNGRGHGGEYEDQFFAKLVSMRGSTTVGHEAIEHGDPYNHCRVVVAVIMKGPFATRSALTLLSCLVPRLPKEKLVLVYPGSPACCMRRWSFRLDRFSFMFRREPHTLEIVVKDGTMGLILQLEDEQEYNRFIEHMRGLNLIGNATITAGVEDANQWEPYKAREKGEAPSSSTKDVKQLKKRTKKPVVEIHNPDSSIAEQYHVEALSLYGGVSVGRGTHDPKGNRLFHMVLVIEDNPEFVTIKRVICTAETRKSSYPGLVNRAACSVSVTNLVRGLWHFKLRPGLKTLEGESVTAEFGMMFQMEDEEELFLLADRLAQLGIRVSKKVECQCGATNNIGGNILSQPHQEVPQQDDEPLMEGAVGGIRNIQLKEEQEAALPTQDKDGVGNQSTKKRNRKKKKKGAVKPNDGETDSKGEPKEVEKPLPPLAIPNGEEGYEEQFFAKLFFSVGEINIGQVSVEDGDHCRRVVVAVIPSRTSEVFTLMTFLIPRSPNAALLDPYSPECCMSKIPLTLFVDKCSFKLRKEPHSLEIMMDYGGMGVILQLENEPEYNKFIEYLKKLNVRENITTGVEEANKWEPYKTRYNDEANSSSSSKEVKKRTKKPVVGMDGSVREQYHVKALALFGGESERRWTHDETGNRLFHIVLLIEDNPDFVKIKRVICSEERRKSSYPALVNEAACPVSMTPLIREGWHFKVHRCLQTLEGESATGEFGMMFQMEDEEELFLLADRLTRSGIHVLEKVECGEES